MNKEKELNDIIINYADEVIAFSNIPYKDKKLIEKLLHSIEQVTSVESETIKKERHK